MKTLSEHSDDRQPIAVITGDGIHIQGSLGAWLAYLWPFLLLFIGVAICGQLH